MTAEPESLLILGLGNVLCGDDGLGIAAVAELDRLYRLPEGVQAMDGGTLGLSLLHYASQPDVLLMVDAVRADSPAGTMIRLTDDDVAPAIESRLSVHQIGVADLLDGMRWTASGPSQIILLGLVPESIELELGRSPAVNQALPRLVDAIVFEVRNLGFELLPRQQNELQPRHDPGFAPRALGL